MNFRVTF